VETRRINDRHISLSRHGRPWVDILTATFSVRGLIFVARPISQVAHCEFDMLSVELTGIVVHSLALDRPAKDIPPME
jgi:hypothetical protein